MTTEFHADRVGRGFTLVELLIVVAVIVVLLVIIIPILREREHAKLQALAIASPDQVFVLRCYASKEIVEEGEDFIFVGEVVNPTPYALKLRWDATTFTVRYGKYTTVYKLPWIVLENAESEVKVPEALVIPFSMGEIITINARSTLHFKARLDSIRAPSVDEFSGVIALRIWDDASLLAKGVRSFEMDETVRVESGMVAFEVLRGASSE